MCSSLPPRSTLRLPRRPRTGRLGPRQSPRHSSDHGDGGNEHECAHCDHYLHRKAGGAKPPDASEWIRGLGMRLARSWFFGISAAFGVVSLLAGCSSSSVPHSSFKVTVVAVLPAFNRTATACLEPCAPQSPKQESVVFVVSHKDLETAPACTVTARYQGRVFGPASATPFPISGLAPQSKGTWPEIAELTAPNSLRKSSVTVDCHSSQSP